MEVSLGLRLPALGGRSVSRSFLVARWLFLGVAVAYLAALALAPQVYLLDLPYWVYEGAALRAKLLGTATAAAADFPLKTYPVPNSLSQVLLAVLVGPLGAAGAGKAVAVLVLGACLWAFYRLSVRLHGPDGVYRALILAATLAASAMYWNGYLNFQLGLAGLAPAAALSAWYVLAKGSADAAVAEGYPDLLTFAMYKAYTLLKLGPFVHFVNPDGAGVLDGAPVLFVALLGGAALFVAVLGWSLLRGMWTFRFEDGAARRFVVGLALGLAALGLAMPPVWLSVVNPGERFLAVALLLLVAVVPMPRRALIALAFAVVPFVAYDVAVLATQPAPDSAWVESDLARREALGTARQETQFADHLASQRENEGARFPWLVRNRFDQAAYYRAVERGRWTLPLPSTGLIEGTDP